MIPALVLLLAGWPLGEDHWALPKLALSCLAVFAAWWVQPPELSPRRYCPWVVFGAALVLSTFFSWDLGYSLFSIEHSRGLGLVEWAACALLFVYGCGVSHQDLKSAVGPGVAVLVAWAIFERVFLHASRAASLQGGPVVLGETLVVLFPLAWEVEPMAVLVLFAGGVAAQSRAALIAMPVMGFYLIWKEARWS